MAALVLALPVAVLALVVKNVHGPVARLDLAVARGLHGFAVRHHWFVETLQWVSTIGHPTTFRLAATVAAFWLLAVGRPRLALWALVTTWGAALLSVVLKLVVERARPALPDAVAHADGYSFPSGHALGAFVGCAVLLLLWLDLAAGRRRWPGWTAAALATACVCFARVGLGVHYLSDVVGGCLVGLAWTAATTIVFEVWRAEAGLARIRVLVSGLEPELSEPDFDRRPRPGPAGALVAARRALPRLVLPWLALVAGMIVLGEVVTRISRPDDAIEAWFAAHRTPTWNELSALGTLLGETDTVVIVAVAGYLVARLVFRRWLEPTALLFAVVGEVWGFVLVTLVVQRPRPAVPHLDAAPPTSAFPSGHTAAALCCYGMLALLATRKIGKRWPLAVAISLGVAVAISRLYRGMHHLTDVLASGVYAAIWLVVVAAIVFRADERPVRKVRAPRRRGRGAVPP